MENLKDFDLIVKGLEYLPEKDTAGAMISDLLAIAALSPDQRKRYEAETKGRKDKMAREKELLIEEVRMLQGKLITLKRYMEKNNFLKQLDELTGPK